MQYVQLRLEKDKGRRIENKMAAMVTGFSHFPDPGGALDQGVWIMGMFEAFKSGENATAIKRLEK